MYLMHVPYACRYAYRNQPEMGQWNCVMLANSLLAAGLMSKQEAETALERYSAVRVLVLLWLGR